MKNRIIIFIISFFYLAAHAELQCFSNEEYQHIISRLPLNEEQYYNVPNMVNCNEKINLSQLVCVNNKIKNIFLLLSISRIYAYENATHTPVEDYSTYNNDFKEWINNIINKENDKAILNRKLCYIIKKTLSDNFGGEFYYEPKIEEVINSKKNDNGVIIDTLERLFYLGKSCDVRVSLDKYKRGIWYKSNNKFIIELEDKKYKFTDKYYFNYDENVFSLNCYR
ncbi:hypothetical protein [Muribacter muris]|nr:hypothetical protein [Muribacter muris]